MLQSSQMGRPMQLSNGIRDIGINYSEDLPDDGRIKLLINLGDIGKRSSRIEWRQIMAADVENISQPGQ